MTKQQLEPTDCHKALVFLYLQSGEALPENWGEAPEERQIAALAFLCFDGDCDRAHLALVNSAIMGYANPPKDS